VHQPSPKDKEVTRHILLTGRPGVGKTTVIKQLADLLVADHPDGSFTQEIREDGIRKGFELITLINSATLANTLLPEVSSLLASNKLK